MHDFMDINQLSKEFLDNFRTESKISDSNSPSGRAVKVQFKSKLFKMVRKQAYVLHYTANQYHSWVLGNNQAVH